MFTCCPKCETCFRITEQQLAIAKGLVRCGHCQKVFNGSEHLTENLPDNNADEYSLDSSPATNKSEPAAFAAAISRASEHELKESEDHAADSPAFEDHFDLASFSAQDDFSGMAADENDPFALNAEPAEQEDELRPGSSEAILDDLTDDWFKVDEEPAPANETAQTQAQESYEYTDINDGLKEEQNIDDIFSDMHQQLELGMAELEENQPGTGILDDRPGQHKKPAADKKTDPLDDEDEINQAIDSIFADSELPLYGEQLDEQDYRVEKEVLAAFGKDTRIDSSSDNIEFEDEAISLTDLPRPLEGDLAGPADKKQEPDIPRRLRDSLAVAEPEKTSVWKIIAGLFLILLLSGALLAQLALFRNIAIVTAFPQTRPWLEQFCRYAPCRIHAKRDLDKMRILERDIRAHPQKKNALLITATIINRAGFSQPYPDIRVTLSDLTGSVVAQRNFTPADYLGSLNSPFLLMKPGAPVHIRIGVLDPGKDAVNFEFQFL